MLNTVNFCPRCQQKTLEFDGVKKHECTGCGFTYFCNVAAAVAAIIRCGDRVLFVERAREPQAGKLDLPGGFVEKGERAEEALRREVREELGIELGPLTFFDTETNIYEYAGLQYHTLDLYYLCDIDRLPELPCDRAEISTLRPLTLRELDFADLAFSSTWYAMERYAALHGDNAQSAGGQK